jgi:hypothetical protein
MPFHAVFISPDVVFFSAQRVLLEISGQSWDNFNNAARIV